MYSNVTSLPVTGAGSTAFMAAMTGHLIIALLLASLCALTTALLMWQRTDDDFEEES
jgi:hypothetical protein